MSLNSINKKFLSRAIDFTNEGSRTKWVLDVVDSIGEADDKLNQLVSASNISKVLTPQDYGAVGDGITDDSAAMTAWFNALVSGTARNALGGVKGYLPKGTYLTSGLAFSPSLLPGAFVEGIVIEGESPFGSVIKLKNGANRDVFAINVGQTNSSIWPTFWIFRNFAIDGNNANNTAGSCINLFQVDEFTLQNVILVNGADYGLKAISVLGLKVYGNVIWGNNTEGFSGSTTRAQGAIYLKNIQYATITGVVINNFTSTASWPVSLIADGSAVANFNATINDLDIEGGPNGILIQSSPSAIGSSIQINNVQLWGQPTGGVGMDITANWRTNLSVNGGAIFGPFSTSIISRFATDNTRGVIQFNNIDGLSNYFSSIVQDLPDNIIITRSNFVPSNFIPNGDFEFWDSNITNSPVIGQGTGIVLASGATASKDTINFKYGNASLKLDCSAAATQSFWYYQFSAKELAGVVGKYLSASAWIKGSAAGAAQIALLINAPSLPGGNQTYTSFSNASTGFEKLSVQAQIVVPTDTTLIQLRAIVNNGLAASISGVMTAISYIGPYLHKDNSLYGSSNYGGNTIAANAAFTVGTISVPGVGLGNANNQQGVVVRTNINLGGLICWGYVSAANTVTIAVFNPTAAPITYTAGYWFVEART